MLQNADKKSCFGIKTVYHVLRSRGISFSIFHIKSFVRVTYVYMYIKPMQNIRDNSHECRKSSVS